MWPGVVSCEFTTPGRMRGLWQGIGPDPLCRDSGLPLRELMKSSSIWSAPAPRFDPSFSTTALGVANERRSLCEQFAHHPRYFGLEYFLALSKPGASRRAKLRWLRKP